jgi:hypothetical protein
MTGNTESTFIQSDDGTMKSVKNPHKMRNIKPVKQGGYDERDTSM